VPAARPAECPFPTVDVARPLLAAPAPHSLAIAAIQPGRVGEASSRSCQPAPWASRKSSCSPTRLGTAAGKRLDRSAARRLGGGQGPRADQRAAGRAAGDRSRAARPPRPGRSRDRSMGWSTGGGAMVIDTPAPATRMPGFPIEGTSCGSSVASGHRHPAWSVCARRCTTRAFRPAVIASIASGPTPGEGGRAWFPAVASRGVPRSRRRWHPLRVTSRTMVWDGAGLPFRKGCQGDLSASCVYQHPTS
jgi:hypothetical protein